MKVKNVIEQVEHIAGRQPENYLLQVINDALEEIGITKQHRRKQIKIDLTEDKRWYELEDEMIDIFRVEILDSGTRDECSLSGYSTKTTCEDAGGTWQAVDDGRYVMIPKLTDSHKLLKEDEY